MLDNPHGFLNLPNSSIHPFFHPESVAIIGASEKEGSVGRTLTLNLLGAYKGKLFLINPNRDTIFKKEAFPHLNAIEDPIDLAILATPAKTIPDLLEECGKKGVRAAIVISAGFKELGPQGQELENKLIAIASRYKIRLIGPNCLGLMNPLIDLNATFASGLPHKGSIAFLSQSGAMCTAVLDWSRKEAIGFSAFVSLGSMADVSWADLIDYLGEDPDTKSILLYMESIGNPRSFISSARRVSKKKPIIVIKAGRTEEAAQAAASHTGSLAGSDAIFDVAMKRAGVMRVEKIGELFNLASALSKQPLPNGPNLTIITNAGGPSVLATDAAVLAGAKLPSPHSKAIESLNRFLPNAWSHSNPVDILGDAGADRYDKTLEVILQDETNDGILVVLSPQDMTDAKGTAIALKKWGGSASKPILASWMGGPSIEEGAKILAESGIPNFAFPDNAAETFARMWNYKKELQELDHTPEMREDHINLSKREASLAKAEKILEGVRKEKRTILTEAESKEFLQAWDIPTTQTLIAKTPQEAAKYAESIGYPVVVKLYSHTITHKTDVGGVLLNLKNKHEVEEAYAKIEKNVLAKHTANDFNGVTVQKMIALGSGYEIILGSIADAQFGPVVLFGLGGTLVEVFKDSALSLPPLNATLAKQLMEKTKIFEAIKGVRGKKGADIHKLESILMKFSDMIVYHRRIKECDINPLFVSSTDIVALDARIVLYEEKIPDSAIPETAIRAYPWKWARHLKISTHENLFFRAIRPEDESKLIAFFTKLSPSIKPDTEELLALENVKGLCHVDYDHEITLVAELPEASHKPIIGIARLKKVQQTAELKMAIASAYQHMGIGSFLLKQLIEVAKTEKIEEIFARYEENNAGMKALLQKCGFKAVKGSGSFILASLKNVNEI